MTKLFSNMARRLMAAWEARMRGSKSSGTALGSHDVPEKCNPTQAKGVCIPSRPQAFVQSIYPIWAAM